MPSIIDFWKSSKPGKFIIAPVDPEPEFDIEAVEITDELELTMESVPGIPWSKGITIKTKKNSMLVRLRKNKGPLGNKFFIMTKEEFQKRYQAVEQGPKEEE